FAQAKPRLAATILIFYFEVCYGPSSILARPHDRRGHERTRTPAATARSFASHNPAWAESVEQHHVIPGVTVRDIGLSVYGETRSLRDRPGSNEPIGSARQKIAHAMINDAELSHLTGKPRNKAHDPVPPTKKALLNHDELTA